MPTVECDNCHEEFYMYKNNCYSLYIERDIARNPRLICSTNCLLNFADKLAKKEASKDES